MHGLVSSCWLLYILIDTGGVGKSGGFLVWQCVVVCCVGNAVDLFVVGSVLTTVSFYGNTYRWSWNVCSVVVFGICYFCMAENFIVGTCLMTGMWDCLVVKAFLASILVLE